MVLVVVRVGVLVASGRRIGAIVAVHLADVRALADAGARRDAPVGAESLDPGRVALQIRLPLVLPPVLPYLMGYLISAPVVSLGVFLKIILHQ